MIRNPKSDPREAYAHGYRDGELNRQGTAQNYYQPGAWIEWLRGWREGQKWRREQAELMEQRRAG